MDGFKGIMERAGTDSMVAYLAYGDEEGIRRSKKDLYQKQVDDAFEHMFDRLDRELKASCRDNQEICSALSDFSSVCQDAYFKAGMVAGFQLCKNLDMEYMDMKGDGMIKSLMKCLAGDVT